MDNAQNIQDCVRKNLETYFADLGDENAHDVWNMVILCVEKSLLEFMMEKTDSNQSKAAQMLGITRNTLRKKLISHNLLLVNKS